MNNLKRVNDSLGHSIGDQLILNFARLLRNSIPTKHFVGRYGGDEFMAVIYDATRESITEILTELQNEVEQFNGYGTQFRISYSHRLALSTDYNECTLRTLFDKADKYMYETSSRASRDAKTKETPEPEISYRRFWRFFLLFLFYFFANASICAYPAEKSMGSSRSFFLTASRPS